MPLRFIRSCASALIVCLAAATAFAAPTDKAPVLIGIDGEFGLQNSTSAQAIERGARIAVTQINAAGGVLGGRPMEVVTRDHRSIPARGIRNLSEFKAMPDLVALMGGRFSPVVIEQLPALKAAQLPFLAVWSSADGIVDNGTNPNYAFRLSLRDSLAMPFMLEHAKQRGFTQIGLLLTNTAWGRSNLAAAEKHNASHPIPKIAGTIWYNWQEPTLVARYNKLREAGAEAIVLIANDDEAAVLVTEVAALPEKERVPILSHWGVTGGRFVQAAGAALHQVDFNVIQTFSFFNAERKALERFMETARDFGIQRIEDIESPVGVAHAYDMTHILARAIDIARTTDRTAIRAALEKVPHHRGLVREYAPPFTAERHEALGPAQLLMAKYRKDGVLVPVNAEPRAK